MNPWTLDQAAAYDHPYAVRTIVQERDWLYWTLVIIAALIRHLLRGSNSFKNVMPWFAQGVDAAIIPEALGVNPSRTIGALAERVAKLIFEEGR